MCESEWKSVSSTTQDHATGRHAKCSDSSELHRVGVLAGLEREPRVQVLREKIDLLARRNELVVDRLLERHTLLVDGLRLFCLVLRLFVSKQKCEKCVFYEKRATSKGEEGVSILTTKSKKTEPQPVLFAVS